MHISLRAVVINSSLSVYNEIKTDYKVEDNYWYCIAMTSSIIRVYTVLNMANIFNIHKSMCIKTYLYIIEIHFK